MSSKEFLCLWCGRFTESRSLDGMADCDRKECVQRRDYDGESDRTGGLKYWRHGKIYQYDPQGMFIRTHEGEPLEP